MATIFGPKPTQNRRLQGVCRKYQNGWLYRCVWRDRSIVQLLTVQKKGPKVIKPLRIYRHRSHAESQPTAIIPKAIKSLIQLLRQPKQRHRIKIPLHWRIRLPTNKKDAIRRWIDGAQTTIIIREHYETIQA